MQTGPPSAKPPPTRDAAAPVGVGLSDGRADAPRAGEGRGDVSGVAGRALDLVDEVLEALESDELERAEELAERLNSPDSPDED